MGANASRNSNKTPSKKADGSSQVYTLYLLRHGEAAHNVLEKAAAEQARRAALAEGYAADSAETRRRTEKARRSVLDDATLLDSPLTEEGKEQARRARRTVEELRARLPAPTAVYVSPLQRALQTAAIAFPGYSDSVHVRLELQERQTGKPCDTRKPTASIDARSSFAKFSTNRLHHADVVSQLESMKLGTGEGEEESDQSVITRKVEEEEKEMVRRRAKKVFDLLTEMDHKVVCVVSHKGYLRELERGHLGRPDATELKNCELRVYRVTMDTAGGTGGAGVRLCDARRLEPSD